MEVLNRAAIKAETRNFIGQNRLWLKLFLPCLPILLLSGGLSYGISFWRTYSEHGGYEEVRYQTGGGVAGLLLLPLTVAIAGFSSIIFAGFILNGKACIKRVLIGTANILRSVS